MRCASSPHAVARPQASLCRTYSVAELPPLGGAVSTDGAGFPAPRSVIWRAAWPSRVARGARQGPRQHLLQRTAARRHVSIRNGLQSVGSSLYRQHGVSYRAQYLAALHVVAPVLVTQP